MNMINVTINGASVSLPEGSTLQDALNERSIPASGIASAVNDVVIPSASRAATVVNDGDKIIVIKAFYGG